MFAAKSTIFMFFIFGSMFVLSAGTPIVKYTEASLNLLISSGVGS